MYASSAVSDSAFAQPIYFILSEAQLTPVSICVTGVQAGSKNVAPGGQSGQTHSTSNSGKYLDIDGSYTLTNPPSGDSYDQTIGCFSGTDFASFQDVQQAEQIISSLTENQDVLVLRSLLRKWSHDRLVTPVLGTMIKVNQPLSSDLI